MNHLKWIINDLSHIIYYTCSLVRHTLPLCFMIAFIIVLKKFTPIIDVIVDFFLNIIRKRMFK